MATAKNRIVSSPAQSKEPGHIASLISMYLHQSIAPAEHDELDQWIAASDENMKLFEELTDKTTLYNELAWLQEIDSSHILKKIKRKLVFENKISFPS